MKGLESESTEREYDLEKALKHPVVARYFMQAVVLKYNAIALSSHSKNEVLDKLQIFSKFKDGIGEHLLINAIFQFFGLDFETVIVESIYIRVPELIIEKLVELELIKETGEQGRKRYSIIIYPQDPVVN